MSHPTKFIKVITPIALAISLAACGGGGDFGDSGSKGTGTSTGAGSGTSTGTTQVLTKMDNMEIGLTTLSAGGSTGVTVRLRNEKNDLFTEDATVSFSSACASNGSSEIKPSLSSKTGVFTVTYTAKGCEGADRITARVGGLEASGIVNVSPANLGAVEFVSAEPQNILLDGMSAAGKQHTSTVKFQIKNDVGGPLANADVTFKLLTNTAGDGGVSLSTTIGKTDNNGFVSTIVRAGTLHTTVRVQATVDKGGFKISSESSNLVISTGIADQNSLSLSLSNLNPAAWDHFGVEVDVNIIASDRYNTPVPDGTAVAFYTELGQIAPFCATVDGRCTVKWRSSNPRDRAINDINYKHDGITTITAKVIGEESFVDKDSDGVFSDGDIFETTLTKNEVTSNVEKGEAFEDFNDNEMRDSFEPYIDFNGNGQYDSRDDLYTGIGCTHPTKCNTNNYLKDIFVTSQLSLSEDNQQIKVYEDTNLNDKFDKADKIVTTTTVGKTYFIEVFGVTNHGVPPRDTAIVVTSEEAKLAFGNTKVENISIDKEHTPYTTRFQLKKGDKPAGKIKISVKVPGKNAQEFLRNYSE